MVDLDFTFDEKAGKWSDDLNYYQRIQDEGLNNKLIGRGSWLLEDYENPEELKEVYTYLKQIGDIGDKKSVETVCLVQL